MTVTSILNAMTVFLLIHFDSCPAETIMIWLTKQMNTSRFQQSFRGVFVKLFSRKKSQQRWIPILIKLQSNVSKTGLQHILSL